MVLPKIVLHNVVANGLGRVWGVLANIVFVPIFIKLLGSESYGIIVAYATLFASIQVLDAGLSSMLARELARLLGTNRGPETTRSAGDLTRTVEVVSIAVGMLIGASVFLIAPWAATHWFVSEHLSAQEITTALRLMGLVVAVQWPAIAYQGALLGLQTQVRLNLVRIATSSLQSIGAALILFEVSPTIRAYFVWVLLSQTVSTLSLRHMVWRSPELRTASRPSIQWSSLLGQWRFSIGITGIALLSSILTQTDKIILSKTVALSAFATYGVASTVCGVLALIASPVYMAVLPQMTALFEKDKASAEDLYLRCSELVAFLIVPAWIILTFHSRELAVLWIGQSDRSEAIAALLPIIACGSLANAIDTMPYGLQIAAGWTSLSLLKNIVAVILVIPALWFGIARYGTIGAAAVWMILNVGYLVFEIPLMHRKIFSEALLPWYRRALLVPVFTGAIMGFLSQRISVYTTSRPALLLILGIEFTLVTVCLAAILPGIRATLAPIAKLVLRRPKM